MRKGFAWAGDRFVLRSYSPVRTIAGGEVLNPFPGRHKRFQEKVLADLEALKGRDPVVALRVLVDSAGPAGTSPQELAGLIDLPAKQIKNALDRILSQREAISYDKSRGRLIGRETFDRLKEKILGILADFHEKYPVRPGLVKEELKTRVPGLADVRLLAFLLDHMVGENQIAVDRDTVRLASHQPNLADDYREIEAQLLNAYEEGGITPPNFKDVAAGLKGKPAQHKEVLEHLIKNGQIVKVKEDIYYHKAVLDKLWDQTRTYLKNSGELTTPAFKEMTGLSRKYLIPLLGAF